MHTPSAPAASIVIPLYNGARYIASCLDSVLAQTVGDCEILVINDASTDGGEQIVASYVERHPGRIRLLRHADGGNHGIAASRNVGVENALGSYIGFLDQDDLYLPDMLRLSLDGFARHPEVALVYAMTTYIDQDGSDSTLDGFTHGGRGTPDRPAWLFASLLKQNLLPTSTVLVRRSALMEIGLMHTGSKHEFEDWLAWLKISFAHPFLFIPQIVGRYRLHQHNYTNIRSGSALHLDAERLMIEDLYTYLFSTHPEQSARIRRHLALSVRRFLLRARAYHLPMTDIRTFGDQLVRAFPAERGTVARARLLTKLLPTQLAYVIRRIRRRLIGL